MRTELVLDAFEQALGARAGAKGVVHQSDSGNTCRFATRNGWSKPASSRRWAESAIPTTTRLPKRSSAYTRPRSFTIADRGDSAQTVVLSCRRCTSTRTAVRQVLRHLGEQIDAVAGVFPNACVVRPSIRSFQRSATPTAALWHERGLEVGLPRSATNTRAHNPRAR
jgi:hypothetical protein